MPNVLIKHKSGVLTKKQLRGLMNFVPDPVSLALHTPNDDAGHMTPAHVEVEEQELSKDVVNFKDIQLRIDANDVPDRLANLDDRRELILKTTRGFLVGNGIQATLGVWLRLAPGSWGEN